MEYFLLPFHSNPAFFSEWQNPYLWQYSGNYFNINFPENGILKIESDDCQEDKQQKNQPEKSLNQLSPIRQSKIKTNHQKIIIPKKNQKDQEFRQRKQTPNRNLASNTLKIYLKQVRDKKSQSYLALSQIILALNFDYTPDAFLSQLNSLLPTNKSYIAIEHIKNLCSKQHENDLPNLAPVLRSSLRRFYQYQIHCVNIKSIRTTRKIRNQQIKRGRSFLEELFYE